VLRGRNTIIEGWRRYFAGPKAPFSWGPENAECSNSGTFAMTTGPVRDESGKMTAALAQSGVSSLTAAGVWVSIVVGFDRGCSCG
jgi:hypothetical protein